MEHPLSSLRILIQREDDRYIAYCLETGNVAAASDLQVAREMIIEILQDEFKFAKKHNSYENLFVSPAPKEVEDAFKAVAKLRPPEWLDLFPEVHTGVQIAADGAYAA